jgi:hypothetical protein
LIEDQINIQGVTFVNNTGPTCHIEEIDEFNSTNVSLLKEALSHCLDLPDWINNNHIMLYFKGNLLMNDLATLNSLGIKDGSKVHYVFLVA